MPIDHKETRSTLNDLIETCKDGEKGFREAAEGVKNSELRSIFMQYSEQRARFASELQKEVKRLGGEPEKSGSVSGALHRGWLNIKSAVTGHDEGAIIAEAERGEDTALEAYQNALDKDLPRDLRERIEHQHQQVREAHDRIRSMELRMKGGTSYPQNL